MSKLSTYFSLVMVMVFWGANVVAVKILVYTFAPITITAFRIFIASLTVFLVLGIAGQWRKVAAKEMLMMFVTGLLNVVAHHYCLATGLTKTTASNAGIILGMSPLLTALLALIFLRDRFRAAKFIGIIFGFAGVIFIVTHSSAKIGAVSLGDMLIFLAVLAQAVSFIFIKKLAATIDARLLTGWMLLFGSVVLFLASLFIEPDGLLRLKEGKITTWFIFLASAILATGLGQMIYNRAIHSLGAAESAIFINLSPFVSLVASSLFLGETIHVVQWFGFFFIVVGVMLASGAVEEGFSKMMRAFGQRKLMG
ncbi:DMT family transporter [Thermaerobacillus caldiproteolyticus]|uniref:DMT family transporter n=1 Tax=Thermaerobacillus caldiproteolyticus TaxID=247480 RepID=UPI00188AA0E0|nr:DMT family transporter [Anoxybacillus caldiproteolyticus]QPA30886.1 DMT family transporter [Anoxybacillus caldiproteolyticus]